MYLLSLLLVLALPVSVQDGLSQDVDNAINDLVSEQHSESQNARAELVEIGRKASPQLVLALQAENASVQQRHMICEILGKIRDNNPAVIAALTKALEDREEFGTSVASVAASALAWIGDEKAVPALIQVMGSKGEDGTLRVDLDLQLKYEIIRALGILRAAGAGESLRTSLKDMKTTQLGPEDEWAHLIAAAAAAGADWHLDYAGRSRRTMAFASELAAAHPDRVALHAADEGGRFDVSGLAASADEHTRIYACGPARLLDALDAAFPGEDGTRLHLERFEAMEFGEPVWPDPFEVELALSGDVVTVSPGQSVLDAITEQSPETVVLSSCRRGTCGTCEAPVLEGEIEHRDSVLTPLERQDSTVMMVCVSRAACPRIVLDL